MDYLINERRLTVDTILKDGIGYFPQNARLISEDKDHPEIFKLRGRVTVPIYSEFGKLVGIAGRVPDSKAKGWWNTKFVKSSHLYGFNKARESIYRLNKAYIFEGYFDRIVMAQSGLTNNVAAMSTNLGIRRIGLIARYCDRICLCFDTDLNDAGLLGVFRTLVDMYSIGIGRQPSTWKLTMITLPVKVDPDEFVVRHGLAAFLALEKPIEEYKLALAESAYEELKWRINDRKKREQEKCTKQIVLM